MADSYNPGDPAYAVNPTTGRACLKAPFGVACYEGTFNEDGTFDGTHCGVVGTVEDADRWLRGEQPLGLIRIYE
jgi:hypothetical protein